MVMRTHWCGELRADHAGQQVRLAGWVHRRRDHGGVIFLDLRDREGLVQITLNPDETPEAHSMAEKVRGEYVVLVQGEIRRRPKGAENPGLPTGEIEVFASNIEVIAEAETTPFPIEDQVETTEETRLRYRYLDLRRPEMLEQMRLRHRVTRAIRTFLDKEGFIDVETPMLSKSTPEGARDYLVPSRLYPGKFYALLQSPQLFKQLLMISGFDRYYQIVRCFRDEDPRADRQPDFTQLDLEMSFVDQEDVLNLVERLFVFVFEQAAGIEIAAPFERMTYDESMSRYGNDRPDRRFGLLIDDITESLRGTQARVFAAGLEEGGAVKSITVPGEARMRRKEIDKLAAVARSAGAGGLAWIAFGEDGISSPLSSVIERHVEGIKKSSGAKSGDLVLIAAGPQRVVETALGVVRMALRDSLSLVKVQDNSDYWRPLWIVDVPLVEWNSGESRWDSVHHPFTAPREEDLPLLDSDPGAVRAKAYDLTIHGIELAGGSVRIHRPELQRKIFSLIGLNDEEVERRFGWFVEAFKYGAPPHGGIASGVERTVMALSGTENIRDTMAFPKTSMMTDLLTGAPDEVDPAQLEELNLRIAPPKQ